MPEEPARSATGPARPVADGGIGWHWMGSNEPLFQRVAGQVQHYIEGNGLEAGRSPARRAGTVRAPGSQPGFGARGSAGYFEARGVVLVRHGKGVFVAAPDEGERAMERFARLREVGLEELFAMREVLEVAAAGWTAAAATDDQLQELVQTFDALAKGVHDQDPATNLKVLDARLHLQIAEYASNRFLTMTQSVLQEMLGRSMETTLTIPGQAGQVRPGARRDHRGAAGQGPGARAGRRPAPHPEFPPRRAQAGSQRTGKTLTPSVPVGARALPEL